MITDRFVLSPKQQAIVEWFATDETWLFLSGTVRSGKTFALNFGWVLWTQAKWKHPTNFIVAGHSVGSVFRNVLDETEMARVAGMWGLSWNYHRGQSCIQCGKHRYHVFGSKDADSADAVRGMTAGGAYLDEMTLMDPKFVEMVISRCSLEGAKIIGSTNPDVPMHYIKLEYIDRVSTDPGADLYGRHLELGFDDNPVLDPEYVERLRRTLTGAQYERLFLGRWVANSGLIHPDVPQWSTDLPRFDRRNIVAIDYATSGITAMLLCRMDSKNNTVVTDEFYHDGGGEGSGYQLTDRELVGKLTEFVDRNGLTQADVEVLPDPSASSFKRECRNKGWSVRDVNNDVLEGIRVANVAFKQRKLFVHPQCRTLLRELGTYVWNEKAAERGEDLPLKTRSHHGVDAIRYYAMLRYRWLIRTKPMMGPFALRR